jgi:hypothetical protein
MNTIMPYPNSTPIRFPRTLALFALQAIVAAGILAGSNSSAQALGALSIGDCGAWGGAWNYSTVAEARRRAMQECKGRNCKVVVNLSGNCVAFAVDQARSCGAWGWATRSTKADAERVAIEQCEKSGGRNCRVRAQFCDSPLQTAPALSTNWKDTDLAQDDCVARAEQVARDAGLTTKLEKVGQSIFGENGDYTGWVRCIADKNIVVFVVAGPELEEARKFLRAMVDAF